jgi:predicted LPLAT superfamily acyltransferase
MQERGSMWGLRLTVFCVRTFGRLLSLPLVLGVVTYFFLTDAGRRAASRAYLARVRAHMRPTPTWRPGRWRCFLHYWSFASSIADRVVLWGGRQDAFEFAFHGKEHFAPHLREGRGLIVLGAHLGSFDALRVLGAVDRVPVNVLMYTAHAPRINEVFRRLSPDADMRVISADPESARTAFEIRSCIERGELVAILADRVEPGDHGRVCEVELLGAKVALPEAPFLLPVVLGCPAVLMLALRGEGRRFDVHAEPLAPGGERVPRAERDARAQQVAARYARHLEQYCVRAPLQWFNFYDYWGEVPPA